MKTIETEIIIQATAERVWSILTDFGKYPQWNPFIREASGEAVRGARLRIQIHPPDGTPMVFRPIVQEATPGRELRWLGRLFVPRLFDGEHVFRIDAAEAGGVRFRQSESFRGILVPVFPSSVYTNTRRGFEAMNRALEERLENAREER